MTPTTQSTSSWREELRALLRANRRPVMFAIVSFVCLLVHHIVVRIMGHDHVAHHLLSSAHTAPPPRAAALVAALAVGRFVSVMLVPGLLLAAAAELLAYLLVGPVREEVFDDYLEGPATDGRGEPQGPP